MQTGANQRLISRLFDGVCDSQLSWKELGRKTLRLEWGLSSDDPLPDFLVSKIGVPEEDLLEQIGYGINIENGLIRFSQSFSNTTPAYNSWGLYFCFGKSVNPENRSSALFSPVYADAKLNFERSDYLFSLTLMQQNLRMVDSQFWRNQFTEVGDYIMKDFIENIQRLKTIKGLEMNEHFNLKVLLETVKSQYEAGELEPHTWFYGV